MDFIRIMFISGFSLDVPGFKIYHKALTAIVGSDIFD